jgi:hypothetical protein
MARKTHQHEGISSSREESFQKLKQKCMDQVKNKRAQILATMRKRGKGQSSSPPPVNFVSESIRKLVRKEVRSQVTGKRGREDGDNDGIIDLYSMELSVTGEPKQKKTNYNSGGSNHIDNMVVWGEESGEMGLINDGSDDESDESEESEAALIKEWSDSDIEFMIQMEEEILMFLKNEENEILLEYFETMHEREVEQELEAASEEATHEQMYEKHFKHMNGDVSKIVLCPMCEYSYLLQNRSVIFCECGFRFDSKSDAIGLRHTKQALDNVMSKHVQSSCNGSLQFELTQMFGSGEHLMAKCEKCNNFEIVM